MPIEIVSATTDKVTFKVLQTWKPDGIVQYLSTEYVQGDTFQSNSGKIICPTLSDYSSKEDQTTYIATCESATGIAEVNLYVYDDTFGSDQGEVPKICVPPGVSDSASRVAYAFHVPCDAHCNTLPYTGLSCSQASIVSMETFDINPAEALSWGPDAKTIDTAGFGTFLGPYHGQSTIAKRIHVPKTAQIITLLVDVYQFGFWELQDRAMVVINDVTIDFTQLKGSDYDYDSTQGISWFRSSVIDEVTKVTMNIPPPYYQRHGYMDVQLKFDLWDSSKSGGWDNIEIVANNKCGSGSTTTNQQQRSSHGGFIFLLIVIGCVGTAGTWMFLTRRRRDQQVGQTRLSQFKPLGQKERRFDLDLI